MSARKERGAKAFALGLWAESLASLYLSLKGYRIVARRYKVLVGELDLVALKGGALVFVEVKARPTEAMGLEAVTPAAQSRLARAAEHFARTHPALAERVWRFDVVVVRPWRLPRHFRHAFSAQF